MGMSTDTSPEINEEGRIHSSQHIPPAPVVPAEAVTPISYGNRKVISQKVQRIIIYTYAAVAMLLFTRFLLSLLAANIEAPFVNFIYQLSMPLMLPFANMFGPVPQTGIHRIEFEVLVALLIYALLFFGIAKLINIIFD